MYFNAYSKTTFHEHNNFTMARHPFKSRINSNLRKPFGLECLDLWKQFFRSVEGAWDVAVFSLMTFEEVRKIIQARIFMV
jgi:hypothetical protein